MILPSNPVFNLMAWIAERFGLVLDLSGDRAFDPLDEGEIDSQLQHGRD